MIVYVQTNMGSYNRKKKTPKASGKNATSSKYGYSEGGRLHKHMKQIEGLDQNDKDGN